MIFPLITLLTALVISSVAIYYSVTGLAAIFAASAVPIIIMGMSLESSNAGLYYLGAEEFVGVCERLLTDTSLAERLASNGRAYFQDQYSWPEIGRAHV